MLGPGSVAHLAEPPAASQVPRSRAEPWAHQHCLRRVFSWSHYLASTCTLGHSSCFGSEEICLLQSHSCDRFPLASQVATGFPVRGDGKHISERVRLAVAEGTLSVVSPPGRWSDAAVFTELVEIGVACCDNDTARRLPLLEALSRLKSLQSRVSPSEPGCITMRS